MQRPGCSCGAGDTFIITVICIDCSEEKYNINIYYSHSLNLTSEFEETYTLFFQHYNKYSNIANKNYEETIKLFSELKEFLDERKELQNTDIMKTFCSNIKHSDWQFINTIAVDFNFLNNLTSELASDLKGQISELVKRFVEEHLGSKYL